MFMERLSVALMIVRLTEMRFILTWNINLNIARNIDVQISVTHNLSSWVTNNVSQGSIKFSD